MKVERVVPRDETFGRLEMYIQGYTLTWAADDRQIIATSDGVNVIGPPKKAFHTCVIGLRGDPENARFEDVPSFPHMPITVIEGELDVPASYWGESCLAVGNRIYQFTMTTNHPYIKTDGSFWPDFRAAGSKLIYSPDNGVTWLNQHGSPVAWEDWNKRSRNSMAFFNEEPLGAFATPKFLQMGKAYQANTDGYAYVYSSCGDITGNPDQLVMFRVPKEKILDRGSYEYFSGRRSNGEAEWSGELARRAAVHTFPTGWASTKADDGMMPFGWSVNVVYNEPLELYMLVAQGNGVGPDGGWHAKPGYLGIWVGKTPWGPFEQVHENSAWTIPGNPDSRPFWPQIAPKWTSADGKSIWIAWSDYQYLGAKGETQNPDAGIVEVLKTAKDHAEFAKIFVDWNKAHMAGVGFNMQRFDFVLGDA